MLTFYVGISLLRFTLMAVSKLSSFILGNLEPHLFSNLSALLTDIKEFFHCNEFKSSSRCIYLP